VIGLRLPPGPRGIIGQKKFGNFDTETSGKKGDFNVPDAMELPFNASHHVPADIKAVQLKPFRQFCL